MAQQQAATVLTEPTHRYLEVEGRKLHYLDWGGDPDKRTFVLLHGGAAHAHWWDGVAPMLTPYGRVLALDFRGHGRSQWADSKELRAAGVSERRPWPDRQPRHARGAGRAFDGRGGRAVGGSHASGVARRTGHRRFAARRAAAVSPPDVAMAPAIARRRSPGAALRRRHHQKVSPAAAPDESDAAGNRAARDARRRAAAQWRVGVSLRSGNAGLAQAWQPDDAGRSSRRSRCRRCCCAAIRAGW